MPSILRHVLAWLARLGGFDLQSSIFKLKPEQHHHEHSAKAPSRLSKIPVMKSARRLLGRDRHKYTLVGHQRGASAHDAGLWTRKHSILVLLLIALAGFAFVIISSSTGSSANLKGPCDTVAHGFQCYTDTSHFWGQYSPYFSVPSEISPDIPHGCSITFAQVLSRHGARDPTKSKSDAYKSTIQKVQKNVKKFSGKYAFLKDYEYTLGADQLTTFGEQQLVNSGIQFYKRYEALTRDVVPFVRTSGQNRVIESARSWTQGFATAKIEDEQSSNEMPHINAIIPEEHGVNNTLSHDLCTAFEDGKFSTTGDNAKGEWAELFANPICKRLNTELAGAQLTLQETISMMDLCPFSVVASLEGKGSPFCALFTEEEWHQYNYYETLDKWYGYSYGNALGPTQGVGFVNELIARITDKPVQDDTSTNHTLDDNPKTFPLGRVLYADFSHDNDMTAIFSAVGLYNGTKQLPNTTIVEAQNANGYSAAWTVPFAARAYFEKMTCKYHKEELVRVIVNDRVMPLTQCGGDGLGRCTLKAFIDSLAFTRSGGHWDQCFV